jgi:stearoyl-CoA desaturase (delta-9 desaturase)
MTISERAVERRQDYDGASPFPGAEEHAPASRA